MSRQPADANWNTEATEQRQGKCIQDIPMDTFQTGCSIFVHIIRQQSHLMHSKM
jgi:hypothetical protein